MRLTSSLSNPLKRRVSRIGGRMGTQSAYPAPKRKPRQRRKGESSLSIGKP